VEVLALAVTTLVLANASQAATEAACSVARTAPVSFRGPGSADRLSVAVVGPCTTARLRISIHTVDGALLYGYDAPFVGHVVVPQGQLPRAARDLAARVLTDGMGDNTASLPPYAPPYEYCSQHYGVLKVTRQQYEALRREKQPMLRHPIGHEASKIVVYDTARRRALTLLESGSDRCP
jgi:hypothetical protein